MKLYTDSYWQITIPDDWIVESDPDCVSVYHEDSFGVLQISAEQFEEDISFETLQEFAEEHIDAGADPEEVGYGVFEGFTLDYDVDNEYWREWYLKYDRLFVFVTYNCSLEDESNEDDIIDTILDSLRINTH